MTLDQAQAKLTLTPVVQYLNLKCNQNQIWWPVDMTVWRLGDWHLKGLPVSFLSFAVSSVWMTYTVHMNKHYYYFKNNLVLNFRSFGKSWNITFHLNGQAVIVCERFFFSRFLKKMPRTFFNQSLMDRQTEMIEKIELKMEFLCRRWIKGRWNAWLREKSKVGSVMWRQLPLKTPTRKKTTRQLGPW